MGIDRQRIVDNFYPPGPRSPATSPRARSRSDARATSGTSSIPTRPGRCWPRPASRRVRDQIHLRDVVRGYLAAPEAGRGGHPGAAGGEPGDHATIDVQESTTFIDNAEHGRAPGIHLLGWGADYPDPRTSSTTTSARVLRPQFGDKFDDVTEPLGRAPRASRTRTARPPTRRQQCHPRARADGPDRPRRLGGRLPGRQRKAATRPLGNEDMAVIAPGPTPTGLDAERRADGLYCADETDGESLRVCEQVKEALYAYEIGGTAASRRWPRSARRTRRSTSGPAPSARASRSTTGRRSTRTTWSSPTRSSGMRSTRSTSAGRTLSTYLAALWGGS